MAEQHIPVLVRETVHYLNCSGGGVFVDATLGDGGHALEICRSFGPQGRLVGLDWDREAVERSRRRLHEFAGQVELIHDSYTRLEQVLAALGITQVNGILLDLGVSTLQLTDPGRGFSFHEDTAGLDMRMDPRLPVQAADLVNTLSQEELFKLISRYGEEPWAGRIASFIVKAREKEPITTSGQLVEIIKAAIPAFRRRRGGHPARRTFQALRLAVNRELDNIAAVLPQAVRCLAPEGRLCVISYHSLEDRLVKNFFREHSGECRCPPRLPCQCRQKAVLKVVTARAVRPAAEEIERNPRSRSARLRVAAKNTF